MSCAVAERPRTDYLAMAIMALDKVSAAVIILHG
jgi:hypothetical protein